MRLNLLVRIETIVFPYSHNAIILCVPSAHQACPVPELHGQEVIVEEYVEGADIGSHAPVSSHSVDHRPSVAAQEIASVCANMTTRARSKPQGVPGGLLDICMTPNVRVKPRPPSGVGCDALLYGTRVSQRVYCRPRADANSRAVPRGSN